MESARAWSRSEMSPRLLGEWWSMNGLWTRGEGEYDKGGAGSEGDIILPAGGSLGMGGSARGSLVEDLLEERSGRADK